MGSLRGHDVPVIWSSRITRPQSVKAGFVKLPMMTDRRPGVVACASWVAASPHKTPMRRVAF
jgi:hypothetical protein